jgi:WD40 repeat protein
LWNATAFERIGRTLWHPGEVTHVEFHPTKQGRVTVDSKQTVRLWELRLEICRKRTIQSYPSRPSISMFEVIHSYFLSVT